MVRPGLGVKPDKKLLLEAAQDDHEDDGEDDHEEADDSSAGDEDGGRVGTVGVEMFYRDEGNVESALAVNLAQVLDFTAVAEEEVASWEIKGSFVGILVSPLLAQLMRICFWKRFKKHWHEGGQFVGNRVEGNLQLR